MTPQMQQSIQLLQMNSMDLEMLIREEMLENPFLEMSDDEEALETAAGDSAEQPEVELIAPEPESGLSDEAQKNETPEFDTERDEEPFADRILPETAAEPAEAALPEDSSSEFETFGDNDVDWNEEFADSDISYSGTREEVEENDFTLYTGAMESLYDSLNRQLHLSVLGGKDFEIGEFLIGNLNNDGYLDCTLENQCLILGYPAELVDPDSAGSAEKVDERLRRMLAKLHGGENPEAFVGMKRKEIILRIMADIVGATYDELLPLQREALLVKLIAHVLKKPLRLLMSMPPTEIVLHTIGHRLKVDPDRVFDVLEVIQEFEPTGVGARDLAECLRLQCEEKGIRNRLLYQILEDHLADLQQKRFREIARALNVPEDKVTEVFSTLSTLNPKPGSSKTKDRPQYITPDVYVKKVDGKYLYFLNEGDAGRLKVASNYRRLMAQRGRRGAAAAAAVAAGAQKSHLANGTSDSAKGAGLNGANADGAGRFAGEDADYASEKYKSAVWLIRNIEKRKSTILRVTEAIMDYQKEFLDKGIEHLRPLTLRDIAERVGMHESTIARVTTKKYVETPRGIFELKYFFSSGLETDEGEAASSRSIKELLTQIIEGEDKRRPLSDQKIADMLRKRGFQIARRTVAKYREQLKILPAKLRKEVK